MVFCYKKYSTKIIEGRRDDARWKDKINQYNNDLNILLGEKAREDVNNKLAFLNSKAAVLSVGYCTELELREKGDRVEDAINATRAAIEEGIVPGGGLALLKASALVNINKIPKELRSAASVLLSSCKRPLVQIADNSGVNSEEVLAEVTSGSRKRNFSAGKNQPGIFR